MNDKVPKTNIDTDTTERAPRLGKCARRIGAVALIASEAIVLPLVPTAINVSSNAPPDSSPVEMARATGRQLESIFNEKTEANPCPVKPDDISFLKNTERWITPTDKHEDIVGYGESLGLSFAESNIVSGYSEAIKKATSVEQVAQLLNYISTEQLNVAIKTRDLDKYPAATPDLETFKNSSVTFLQIMSLIPKELYDETGLTSVVIAPVVAETTNENTFSMGTYDSIYKSVTLDYDWIRDPRTVIHEVLGHGTHDTSCNGYTRNDQAIRSQNPANEPYLSRNESLEGDYNHKVWATDYARADVQEDAADTTTALLLHSITIEVNGSHEPLTDKMMIIADRIDKLTPGSVKYFRLAGPYMRSTASD